MGAKQNLVASGKAGMVLDPKDISAGLIEADARRLLEQRRPADAVAMALHHGLLDLAAELLACGSADLVRGIGDYEVFFQVIDKLGAERVRRWPELDAAAIWALALSNRLRLASVRLDELEARIPALLAEGRSFVVDFLSTPFDRIDPRSSMQCWAGMMRALIAGFAGEGEQALRLAEQWRAAFPLAPEYEVATVNCAFMLGYSLTGRLVLAERHGLMALSSFRSEGIEYGLAWSASGVALTLMGQGRVSQARAIIDDARLRIASRLVRPTHAQVPLRLLEAAILFESGDFAALLEQPETGMDAYPGPLMGLAKLRVGVRLMLALGRTSDALALLDGARFEGSALARAMWEREFAMEQALAAAIAGESDRRYYGGSAAQSPLLELIADACRNPSPSLLGGLRTRLLQAQDQKDSSMMLLLGFMKARVERDAGNALQARRSIHKLLTCPLTRERIGTLAAFARGLQPLFGDVLCALLRDSASTTPELLRLAGLLGLSVAGVPPSSPRVKLSKRERQAALALLDGLANREIADRLHVTEQTVKWHLWNLFQKLGVRNRTSAVRALTRQGFTATA